jgi:hypothetical protein
MEITEQGKSTPHCEIDTVKIEVRGMTKEQRCSNYHCNCRFKLDLEDLNLKIVESRSHITLSLKTHFDGYRICSDNYCPKCNQYYGISTTLLTRNLKDIKQALKELGFKKRFLRNSWRIEKHVD